MERSGGTSTSDRRADGGQGLRELSEIPAFEAVRQGRCAAAYRLAAHKGIHRSNTIALASGRISIDDDGIWMVNPDGTGFDQVSTFGGWAAFTPDVTPGRGSAKDRPTLDV